MGITSPRSKLYSRENLNEEPSVQSIVKLDPKLKINNQTQVGIPKEDKNE